MTIHIVNRQSQSRTRPAALEAAKHAVLGELDLWDVPNYVHPTYMNWPRFAEHIGDSVLDAIGYDALLVENARLRNAVHHLNGEFDPESIRWDGLPAEQWEGNGPCQDCDRPSPNWRAPNDLWDAVMGTDDGTGGVVCPSCFARRYGAPTQWTFALAALTSQEGTNG